MRGYLHHRRPAPQKRSAEVIAAEKAEKDRQSKTCQICGRSIFAETGTIAHHGYERPFEGWQTASCNGAKRLPFEVSCEALKDHMAHFDAFTADIEAGLAEVVAERAPAIFSYKVGIYRHDKRQVTIELTRESFDAIKAEHAKEMRQHSVYDFDSAKQRHIDRIERDLSQRRLYSVQQHQRLDGWKQTHQRGPEGGPVWVAA
jgi:hypothetical protein